MTPINYSGRVFRLRDNSAVGDAGLDTTFHFQQRGTVVWASYEGSGLQKGQFIGLVEDDGTVDLRFQQVTEDGRIRIGEGRQIAEVQPDGRLVLHEDYRFLPDGPSGQAVLEETGPPGRA